MAKEDEEATKATFATMVETIAMATILVVKAKTTKIGDEIQKNASRSRSRPANANSSRHGDYQPNFNNRPSYTANVTRKC